MGIRHREHLAAHPLRGQLFENLALLEVLKTYTNAGERPDLHFFRDSAGNEADLVLEQGASLILVEIKSARTVASDAMRAGEAVRRGLGNRVRWAALVYDGSEAQRRSSFDVVPCGDLRRWLIGS